MKGVSPAGGALFLGGVLKTHPEPNHRFRRGGNHRVNNLHQRRVLRDASSRQVVVFLFFRDNLTQGVGRIGVYQFEGRDLLMEMAKDDTLNGNRCRGDCSAPKKARDRSECETADCTEMVTPTPSQPASIQHSLKSRAVAPLMVTKMA